MKRPNIPPFQTAIKVGINLPAAVKPETSREIASMQDAVRDARVMMIEPLTGNFVVMRKYTGTIKPDCRD